MMITNERLKQGTCEVFFIGDLDGITEKKKYYSHSLRSRTLAWLFDTHS